MRNPQAHLLAVKVYNSNFCNDSAEREYEICVLMSWHCRGWGDVVWSALQVHSIKTQKGTSRELEAFPEESGYPSHTNGTHQSLGVFTSSKALGWSNMSFLKNRHITYNVCTSLFMYTEFMCLAVHVYMSVCILKSYYSHDLSFWDCIAKLKSIPANSINPYEMGTWAPNQISLFDKLQFTSELRSQMNHLSKPERLLLAS